MSNYLLDGYHREAAAYAPTDERTAFIRRTYGLLFMAIVAFVGLEAFLVKSGVGVRMIREAVANPMILLLTLVVFIASGFIARMLARSSVSPAVQMMGLALYVGMEVLIFLPIMTYCTMVPQYQNIPLQAGILTMIVFGGLTATVFISKKDFSFLGKILMIASWTALGVVVLAIMMPGSINLGLWFSAAMIALSCGYILYDTSNVLHHYPTNAHTAAALELFASVALLYYYIIRLMLELASIGDR